MHVMQLRSPWKIDRNDGSGLLRCELPDFSPSRADQVVYQRSFNRPTGLVPEQRLWLFIQEWMGLVVSLTVNGCAMDIGSTEFSCQVEISRYLERHNVIELRLAAVGDVQPRLVGPVELRIESVT
jgi:hypothetical protein